MNPTVVLTIGFLALTLPLLAFDLGLFQRRAHTVTLREALLWSGLWIALALLFAGGVFYFRGTQKGMEFLTGYLIEQTLSVDNVFLFALLFSALKIPSQYQHRVLFWGVISAIGMRGIMILAGAALLERFHWIIYIFGGLLIVTGIRMLLHRGALADPTDNRLLRWIQRHIPLTPTFHGQSFLATESGKKVATPLFLALVLVEATDLMFAMDSIPAIFAVTRDPFIVFTSNVFAILGLRSLYFVLAGVMEKFTYLKVGLAAILIFVGFKMLEVMSVSVGVSLLVVLLILCIAIVMSVWRAQRQAAEAKAPRQEESPS